MAVLCKLADPAGYRAFDWDVREDPADFDYWLDLFEKCPAEMARWLREDGLAGDDFERRWAAFRTEYEEGICARRADPDAFGPVDTLTLGAFRQAMLHKHDWPDPYLAVKRRENERAAEIYPDLIARIDRAPADERWGLLLRSLFAGNMFDLGTPETIEMYHRGRIDFFAMLSELSERPWFIDHADQIVPRLAGGHYRKVLFFADNAGSDVVLGAVPLVREIARAGTPVVLAANSRPALNDITHDELVRLLDDLAGADPVLAELRARERITTVATGTGVALIDLSEIGEACNAVAADCDLIVLEGMGRAVESNWNQRFTCDVWRLAVIKDACVAKWLGCELFQPVCRFDPASSPTPRNVASAPRGRRA